MLPVKHPDNYTKEYANRWHDKNVVTQATPNEKILWRIRVGSFS